MSGSTHRYSFGGPFGVACIMFSLPLAAYYLNWLVIVGHDPTLQWPHHVFMRMYQKTSLTDFLDVRAVGVSISWLLFHIFFSFLPLGSNMLGQPLKSTGKRLSYRCNGIHALLVSMVGFFIIAHYQSTLLIFIYDKWLAVITSFFLLSLFISTFLYLRSFTVDRSLLADRGNTGSIPYDFFMGRELNPRIFGADLKFIIELRPGLIGWVLADLLFCWIDVQNKSSWFDVQPTLAIVTLFHILYAADALFFEAAILSTMDILDEGFGFMLCNGNLMVVPFIYSLTTHYLLNHPVEWSVFFLIGFFIANFVGYVIFRGANYQKDSFRRGDLSRSWPNVKVIPTVNGKCLLVDGWWAVVRHPNYLGDIIMAIVWSLPAGFSHIVAWLYPIYLVGLLVGREFRDEDNCEQKYGKAWREYRRLVPHRIVPGIF